MFFKNKFGHFLTINWRIHGSFSDKDLAFVDILYAHLCLKSVFPKLAEVIPVLDHALSNRISNVQ